MRLAVVLSLLAIGCSGEQGDPGASGAVGEQGAAGEKGAQGETGARGSHVEWVDGDGNVIPNFAMLTLAGFSNMGLGSESPVVIDANDYVWLVTIDPTTLTASAGPFAMMFTPWSYYTGTACSGDKVIQVSATAPRNVPFTVLGDATIRIIPDALPTAIPVLSQSFPTCSNITTSIMGYVAADTLPATTLTPPTLTWKGPIQATWVE